MAGQANMLGAPNRLFADQSDPFAASAPTQADAVQYTAQAYQAWLDQQRQSGVASGMIDPQTGWPTGNALLDAARQYGGAMIGGTSGPGFKVYHGSPHSFDRFDLGKIGTGEGAQAYGHGLYFADKEGVARSYRDDLTAKRPSPELVDAQNAYNAHYNAVGKAMSGTNEEFAAAVAARDEAHAKMLQIKSDWEAQPTPTGHMYEVNVNADPAHFLDWDKPLSEQTPHVQQKITNLQNRGMLPRGWNQDDMTSLTGGHLYQELSNKAGSSEKTARMLAEPMPGTDAGIPGIRYLDGGSRAGGDGTSNHVIFDPATIEILRKYGIAGLIGGGAAAAGQQTQ